MKELSEYTPQELQEIGRKTVSARIKEAGNSKVRNALMSSLLKAYNEGKIKLPAPK